MTKQTLKEVINKLCLLEKTFGGDVEVWIEDGHSGNASPIGNIIANEICGKTEIVINGKNF